MTGKMKIEVEGYEAFEKTVTATGTSAHVYIPPDWIGKKVKIILLDPLD